MEGLSAIFRRAESIELICGLHFGNPEFLVSHLFFPDDSSRREQGVEFAQFLRVRYTEGHDQYLGLPMAVGIHKKEVFQYICDRV